MAYENPCERVTTLETTLKKLITSIGELTRQFEDSSTYFVCRNRNDYFDLEFNDRYCFDNGQHDRDHRDDDCRVYRP